MSIESLNRSIGSWFNKGVSSPKNIKKLNGLFADPNKAITAAMVTSIVSKDAVGCVLYTSQSATNKKIPEEKRPFVAALDLVNGILMVGGQYLIGKTIVEKWLQPTLVGKHLTATIKGDKSRPDKVLTGEGAKKAKLATENLQNLVKEVFDFSKEGVSKKALRIRKSLEKNGLDLDSLKKLGKEDIEKLGKELISRIGVGSNKYKLITSGFGILIAAIATTALTKRTLVPLISTPLAGALSDKFVKNKKDSKKPEENIINTKMDPASKMAYSKDETKKST